MKNFIMLAFSVCSFFSYGQTWYQDGDQWVNQIHAGYFGGLNGFEEIEVDGDTIVDDQSYKKLTSKFALHVLGGDTLYEFREPYLLREKNDSVFHRYNSKEYLIYDFTMEVGDTLLWYSDEHDNGCPSFFRLDSIYDTVIDGDTIKIQRGFVYSFEAFVRRFIQIYETVGAVDSKIAPFSGEWFAGFFIPRTGLSCLQDYSPPTLCQFTSKDFKLKEEDETCYEISSSTQDWFKWRAKWFYSINNALNSATRTRALEYQEQSDTLIFGETYASLTNTVFAIGENSEMVSYEEEPFLMREDGRKVYYWDGDTSHLIYDFTMAVGDTLDWNHTVSELSDGSTFILDSLSIENVWGAEIHVQTGRVISGILGPSRIVQIYESIGLTRSKETIDDEWVLQDFLIPEFPMDCIGCEEVGSLCFYINSGEYSYPENKEESDCFNLVSSVENPKIDLEIKIAPNPVNENFQLIGDLSSFESYTIYDINGRKIAESWLVPEFINVANLPSGLYFLNLQSRESASETLRFSKIN